MISNIWRNGRYATGEIIIKNNGTRQVQQLHRASSLPPVEQNGMIAAIVFSRQSRLQFDTCWIDNLQVASATK
jgi:hypothetical protein